MTINEYAAKIEELVKFYLHYNYEDIEGSKCTKFESKLRYDIKQDISYQEIH